MPPNTIKCENCVHCLTSIEYGQVFMDCKTWQGSKNFLSKETIERKFENWGDSRSMPRGVARICKYYSRRGAGLPT